MIQVPVVAITLCNLRSGPQTQTVKEERGGGHRDTNPALLNVRHMYANAAVGISWEVAWDAFGRQRAEGVTGGGQWGSWTFGGHLADGTFGVRAWLPRVAIPVPGGNVGIPCESAQLVQHFPTVRDAVTFS